MAKFADIMFLHAQLTGLKQLQLFQDTECEADNSQNIRIFNVAHLHLESEDINKGWTLSLY
jgi:hypothetical protein